MTKTEQAATKIFTDTIRRYIDVNAGMFASEAEAYIPGIVAALIVALDAHKLQIIDHPTTPSVS